MNLFPLLIVKDREM